MSRIPLVLLVALLGCRGKAAIDDSDTGAAGDTTDTDSADADTDADSDADADTDTDSDADTDADADTNCPAVTPDTKSAVVTDIDETLTTSDNEWLTQLAIPSHDPAMRPDANTLMNAWHARGYRIFYVTGRGDSLPLLDGTDPRDATDAWLTEKGFPYADSDVYLSSGIGATGQAAADYKTGVIQGLIDQGFDIQYAYGNADSDVTAYKAVGIPDDHDFLVGALAGTLGVVGVPDNQAYTLHLLQWPSSAPCGH